MKKHPKLHFIGAHIGSEEWSVDKIAATLDNCPQMKKENTLSKAQTGRKNHSNST